MIDELTEPVEFLHGGDDLFCQGRSSLEGQELGFETSLALNPQPSVTTTPTWSASKAQPLPDGVDVGMQMEGLPEGAQSEGMPLDAISTP